MMYSSFNNTTTKLFLALAAFLSISACSAFAPAPHQSTGVSFRSELSMAASLMESTRPSFEDRMRNIVQGQRKTVPVTKKPSNMPENIQIATSLDEYKQIVGGERERIVVVRFYAPWCKACKAIRPLFYRLAHENSNVLFVEVPVTETNANLHQGLGIPSLPYGHIYSPDGGLVEELKITRPHFPKFAHKLSSYIKGSCELVNGHVESPYDPRTKELSATP